MNLQEKNFDIKREKILTYSGNSNDREIRNKIKKIEFKHQIN
jgi:hypothetical protein